MVRLSFALVLMLLLAAAGCSVDTNLGGVAVPNARPDTRITGQPPTLLEAGFVVEFNWTGGDPDGRIVGYEWKISDNGTDGISPRDTMTYDPLTGAEMNPWHFTTATDSSFVVLADQANFPGDTAAPRSFRTHSIFVRAVDDKGEVDPTPAYMTFTSTTLVPTARAKFPGLSTTISSRAPSTVNIGWEGTDPDFDLRVPVKVRFLWKRAQINGMDIRLPSEYYQHYEELINFDDPDWSTWQRYAPDENDRLATFPRQTPGTYWLFAVQTQDTAGAVSVGRRYAVEVAHLSIAQSGLLKPGVTLNEIYLGASSAPTALPISIAAGQPLNFSWVASAADYNGRIVSYRHGWDLISVDDPNDPGWAVPPGTAEQNRIAQQRSFQEGTHTFWLRVEDDSGQVTKLSRVLNVVPYVDYENQNELLVIDQVVDERVQNWQDQAGVPRNDETYRNEFWSFLQSQPGGVNGLDWNLDRFDHRDNVTYADLVPYKAVLCYAQSNSQQVGMFNKFKPERGVDKYVWLIPYQERGGNLFLVGGASMDSFLEVLADYMTPVIFDTREETYSSGTLTFTVGFGTKELPDGTEVQRGPLQYPFAVAGISALDWTSQSTKYVYARPQSAMDRQRHRDCVGLKALVLDSDFRQHWLIGPGAVADTIGTDSVIDWQDHYYDQQGTLDVIHNTFPFSNDEFVNDNISTRTTQFTPQLCDDLNAPNGQCIEPMFRGIARFDWLREHKWAQGQTDWPNGVWTASELDDMCGAVALNPYASLQRGSAKTNGKVFGYLSYKMTEGKPSQAPDVYWGFDPYRFDHTQSKKAIRWVLKELFRLDVLDE